MLTNDERLALLNAMDKAIGPALDRAKADARRELLEQNQADGKTDRQGIFIDGEKVGETVISYQGGRPAIIPGYEAEALAYLASKGLVEPRKGWEKSFNRVGQVIADADTGEVVNWAEWEPKTASSARVLGCKPQDVFPAIKNKLGASPMSLLEGEVWSS